MDFTSLYPWCNKSTEAVVGHPEIITENFADISTYFGLIKCTVLPPKGLLHPVLPYRTKDKLMFPLCKTCADTLNQNPCTHSEQERAILGTWCHVELMKAIEKGYQVLKIHEVWHFPEHTNELFKDYVDTFLKLKQEASGYPKECVTDEQKQHYIDEYYEIEGIRLDPENIKHNPGLRSLAKLMLNSLWGMLLLFVFYVTLVSSVGRAWDCSEKSCHPTVSGSIPERGIKHFYFVYFVGKFAQRSNLTKVDMVYEPKRFFELLYADEFEVTDARIVNDNAIEVHYKCVDEFVQQNNKVNVVVAAFTTAYARLKLYDLLDLLQERVLYYDTDSVIYVHKPNKPDPPLGNYLGDLTDELNGDYITSFVSGGPKNYAYRTKKGKTETKIRGITLDYAAMGKLNHDVVRALVHLHVNCNTDAKVTVDMPFKITRDKKEKKIVTKKMKKDYRIVYNKRVITENYATLPYGY